jgi:hypothetical protein
MNKRHLFLIAALAFVFSASLHAQLTIGGWTAPATGAPAKPVAISGSPEVCADTEQTYSIAEVVGADEKGYVWEFPDGWEIIFGDSTTEVTVTAGSSLGTNLIHVWATNKCGGGAAQTLAVTVNSIPDQPGAITGPSTNLCPNTTGLTYSIEAVDRATGYLWTVPDGWEITDGQNFTTITVTAGSGNGTISVTPNNTCGSGTARTLAVAVMPAPAQPTKKDGAASVYQNHAYTCSVNEVAGVTYQWELPDDWTGANPTATLTVTYTPNSPTTPGVTWSSSDASVASVNSNGEVTGLKDGTATITATSIDNTSITATCTVIVMAFMPATGVSIDTPDFALQIGGTTTGTLTATVLPTNTTDKTVTWESSDPTVVSVSAAGQVTAQKVGTATITAKTHNGKVSAARTVTVYPAGYVPPASGIGDNGTIDEKNLLTALDVKSVAAAIAELHDRIINGNMDGLTLGMYLDLPSLTPFDGSGTIYGNTETQNLRIVIASFNQYKTTNDRDHIKFVFKNCPVTKVMRLHYASMHPILSNGGYPYNTDNGEGGIPILKPYLEGPFLNGLKVALGHDEYLYEVRRDIAVGTQGTGWQAVPFYAKIFIDTEKGVFGRNALEPDKLSSAEGNLTQTALYAKGPAWRIKTGATTGWWWTATPHFTTSFVIVDNNGVHQTCFANYPIPVGIAPAFCIW